MVLPDLSPIYGKKGIILVACRWNVKIILLMKKRYQLVMVFIFSIFMANVIEAAAVRVSPSAPLEAAGAVGEAKQRDRIKNSEVISLGVFCY